VLPQPKRTETIGRAFSWPSAKIPSVPGKTETTKAAPLETSRKKKLRNILVATDFSAGAARAVARAAMLPLAPESTIVLLHVLAESSNSEIDKKREAEARRALAATWTAAAPGRNGAAKPRFREEIRRGKPFVEIIRCARELAAELVVIGRHKSRRVRDLFLGSTAERVIRKGDLPVLLVNREPKGPYSHPLIATDLEETSRRALELALRLIDPRVRAIDVVYAYEVPFEGALLQGNVAPKQIARRREEFRKSAHAALDEFLARLGETRMRWKKLVREGDPRRVVCGQVVRRHPDLVALGTHGRTGLAHILIGSVAETVVREVPCDVLVARPAERVFELP
jgi:nucleotide-binding universal stress UspA family protein